MLHDVLATYLSPSLHNFFSQSILQCSDVEAPSDHNLGYVNPAAPEPSYVPSEVRIKETVQREPEGYSRDVRSAFSGLPKVKPQWRDYYMKMLIVGECGQGQLTAMHVCTSNA